MSMGTNRMHIVVFTGSGISAESGIPTFRGAGGLWEGHRLEEVATPEAWERDPETVLRFYNERRRAVGAAQPNAAHVALANLEQRHKVSIITQNIDDLHERAGSTRVLHLHGEIMKVRSTLIPEKVLYWGPKDLTPGDHCPFGSQLRPHVVWFGEEVPEYTNAVPIIEAADTLLVIGTSLQVYPAAGLVHLVPPSTTVYWIDPDAGRIAGFPPTAALLIYSTSACSAVPRIVEELLQES